MVSYSSVSGTAMGNGIGREERRSEGGAAGSNAFGNCSVHITLYLVYWNLNALPHVGTGLQVACGLHQVLTSILATLAIQTQQEHNVTGFAGMQCHDGCTSRVPVVLDS